MKLNLIPVFFSILALSSTSVAAEVPAKVLERHSLITGDDCQSEMTSQAESHKLNDRRVLTLVPCIMGAYQGASKAYISSPSGDSIEQVIVLAYDESARGIVGTTDLGDAQYDADKGLLLTHARGRGIGDCGQSSTSKVVVGEYSVSVKTTQIRSKANCDGRHTRWPVVFSQK